MYKLFLLFLRNGGLLAFGLLEVVSLFLVVQFNPDQEKIFFNSLNNLVAGTDAISQNTLDYLQLDTYADSLARANARMLEKLDNAIFIHQIEEDSIKRTEWDQQYVLTSAKIVDKTVSRKNNFFILNRGKTHGIKKNSGVITEKGLIGIVVDVSKDYSQVMTVLHQQSRLSAALRRTGDFGSLIWDGDDYRYLSLVDVPKHVQPVKGDTIQTSGFSQMFPEGIMIGKIEAFDLEPGSNFYDIRVRLSEDMRTVKYGYIVDNLKRAQIDSLKAGLTE
ncbi:MAG: rod shape-determining protein MreC [Saprospiraceae bacterium]|jgi:rod shape-determining protein MreC